MLYILGILFIAVGIMFSIALHEVGHLLPAKRFGVRVTQYMIGFGPTLFSVRKGETEYGFKAIPLGGYISMIGMYPPAHDSNKLRSSTTGMYQSMISNARKQSEEEIRVEDNGRMFYQLAVWKRLVIMCGGPVMNFLIACVLMTVLLVGFGVSQGSTTIFSVSQCVLSDVERAAGQTQCLENSSLSPAAAAGLLPGDKILSFDNKKIVDWYDLSSAIRVSANKTVPLVFDRDGTEYEVSITPLLNEVAVYDKQGSVVLKENGEPETENVGFIGFSPLQENVRQPLSEVPKQIGSGIARTAGVIFNLPEKMAGVFQAAFTSEKRDVDGPISVVGVGRVAGEISAMDGVAVTSKFMILLSLLASLNLALFVFNLIPLLPLDGGHIAGALYESVRRRIAKLFGREDPGPVDIIKLLPLTYFVAIILMGMGVLLIYADIVKPISLF